ncbi:TspO/MBR family protein [Bacillus cereus]|uniref:TspO/MBR family protein n=1 Tax=Bacillus cereus TaxID=1396 RepID=UPI002B24AB6D|nr:TspO/MBR family protein [Bacillus cereus]MEB2584110.1 TspO/MBR family protein [Bacillus cereus]MEB2611590.1 TspO/MBR family protein [Bacillus cereus]
MKKFSILVFFITYGLFYVSSILFPIDRSWYNSLDKPSWTPSGMTIGIVWAVLYGLIALSVTIIYNKYKFKPKLFWILFVLNYILNQAFSFFQFHQKDLLLATIDCLLVAVTAFLLIIYSFRLSKVVGWLLIPYLLWTTFATYLSWTIYSMN